MLVTLRRPKFPLPRPLRLPIPPPPFPLRKPASALPSSLSSAIFSRPLSPSSNRCYMLKVGQSRGSVPRSVTRLSRMSDMSVTLSMMSVTGSVTRVCHEGPSRGLSWMSDTMPDSDTMSVAMSDTMSICHEICHDVYHEVCHDTCHEGPSRGFFTGIRLD